MTAFMFGAKRLIIEQSTSIKLYQIHCLNKVSLLPLGDFNTIG